MGVFFIPSYTIKDYFSCSLLITSILFLEKNMENSSRKSWIHCNTKWWRHFDIIMTSRIEVGPASSCLFLFFLPVGTGIWDRIISHGQKQRNNLVYEIKIIHHECEGGIKKNLSGGSPIGITTKNLIYIRKQERGQRSGIDTIKYHTWPRTPKHEVDFQKVLNTLRCDIVTKF